MANCEVFEFNKDGRSNMCISIPLGTYKNKETGEEKVNKLTFGVKKAKAILENMDEIEEFVETHG